MVPPCRPERKICDMEKAGYYSWLTLVGETGWGDDDIRRNWGTRQRTSSPRGLEVVQESCSG